MYLLGIIMALLMAWLFKKTLLRGPTPMLIMELPPYKKPVPHVVLRHMWDRAKLFLRRAGTIILGISIILWFLMNYPKSAEAERGFAAKRTAVAQAQAIPDDVRETELQKIDVEERGEQLRRSFAGMAGRAIAPVLEPLGFDWKIGIGIISSFAAREVFVSTMSIVYNVGESEDETQGNETLAAAMKEQKRDDGSPIYTTLQGITLMVFYVLALQCVSTIAVVRRETNTWKWPVFQWVYMGALAWLLGFITYQGGRLLGFE
jgi:ferrous iron transport protein B